MWDRSWRYSKRRHPQKNHNWIAKRYFGRQDGPSKNKWRFFATIGDSKLFLVKFSDFKIKRHVMVENNMLPDNRSLKAQAYWDKRSENKQYLTWANYERHLKLVKKQYHICSMCDESLYNDEELHVHHIRERRKGG